MATARQRAVDRARDREHLAALFGRIAGGDQRTRLEAGFDHQGAEGKSGNDAVAAREVFSLARRARWKLADQGTAGGDFPGKGEMLARIDEIGAGAKHGQGAALDIEGRPMRGGIDAIGHAAGDGKAGIGQGAGKASRDRQAAVAGTAAADNGDLWHPQQACITGDEQGRGSARDFAQQRRIVGIVPAKQLVVRFCQPGQVGINARLIRGIQPAPRFVIQIRCRLVAAQVLQHQLRIAASADELAQRGRAKAGGAHQDQPGFHGHRGTSVGRTQENPSVAATRADKNGAVSATAPHWLARGARLRASYRDRAGNHRYARDARCPSPGRS